MIRRLFSLLIVISVVAVTGFAAETGLFTYNGGFFIKNGKNWTEYRPQDKPGAWNTYTYVSEEDNYYKIKNDKCQLSIPKREGFDFYIWKNGEWQVVYSGRQVFNYFDDPARDIYCYKGGYFVRDGEDWREYRPGDKTGLWASYTQYNEEDNYYNIKSTKDKVSVPKSVSSSFYILRDNDWKPVYTTTNIYDAHAGYTFSFYFPWFKEEVGDKLQERRQPARLSFDRKGNGLIQYGSNSRKFTFSHISNMVYKNTDTFMGVKLFNNNEDEEYIFILESWTMVNMENLVPFMDFMDVSNKTELKRVKKLIDNGTFFK